MLLHLLPLNAFYNAGNKIGPVLTWIFIILMVVELAYVMIKYLGGSEKDSHRG